MLQIISEQLANIIFDCQSEDRELEIYGCKLLISSTLTQFFILVTGIISGMFLESILFLLFFSALRIFVGGYHAKSYLKCVILSIFTYLCVMCLYKVFFYVFMNLYVQIVLFIVSFIIVLGKILIFQTIRSQTIIYSSGNIGLVVLTIEIFLFYVLLFGFFWKAVMIYIPTLIAVDVFLLIQIIKYLKEGVKMYGKTM